MKICTLDGCDKAVKAKLLCSSHYRKLTLYGDPMGGLSPYTQGTNLWDRFYDGVSKPLGEDGCWVWTQAKEQRGYGAFKFQGTHYKAHRVSYELHNEVELNPNTKVRHSCDNPPCVNPRHLSIGSQADNMDDKMHRDRFSSKLTTLEARSIRDAYDEGARTGDLAHEYDVTRATIWMVVTKRTWKYA